MGSVLSHMLLKKLASQVAVLGVARHVGAQSLDPADKGLRALTKVLKAKPVVEPEERESAEKKRKEEESVEGDLPRVGALQGSQSLAGGILGLVSV